MASKPALCDLNPTELAYYYDKVRNTDGIDTCIPIDDLPEVTYAIAHFDSMVIQVEELMCPNVIRITAKHFEK